MPQINRGRTTYHKLPETIKTNKMQDAKLVVGLNILVPKGMEDKAEKFLKECHETLSEGFHKFMKKEIKKREQSNGEEG